MRRSSPKSSSAENPANATHPPAGRYICIHGHFYQPPRENPWLETVEMQDSAAPYHDWNDRITAECYAPNGASRITNVQNEIIRIINNYAHMSFNFGPTLLSWLNDKAPRTYRMILDADKASAQRYDGHGSAIAQVYNHIILPLANERDALTQIRWGIADFVHRFGRRPEGMWLAETAVNRATLDLLAREGIKFTILAPHQCARIRPLTPVPGRTAALFADEGSPWQETPNATVDPRHPYRIRLDEGRSIAVFFYDGPASRAIAFEGLLNSGEIFAQRLVDGFDNSDEPQLVHVATDGESYGHHHKHGEMALSFAMHWIGESKLAALTNYGEFLEKFPPQWEAEVEDNTSWSCAHGIERWRSNCGCNGGKPGWNQEWRKPLREALDFLRDATAPLAEKRAAPLLKDLWVARDAYIRVILSRSRDVIDGFFDEHQARVLTPEERITALELLELERHAQLMYTSCGWFFDEISGIETVQIIAYSGRVLQLACELFGEPGHAIEAEFLRMLSAAKSNVPELRDGAEIYRRYVTGMKIGLEQVGAHYAISSIFRNYPEDGELFCFDLRRDAYELFASGRGRVAVGRAHIVSRITEETEEICFAVLHLGDQNLSAAVKRYTAADQESFTTFAANVRDAIGHANLPEVIRLIDRFFAPTAEAAPEAAVEVPHIALDPTQPEPGRPATDVAPGIAHTLVTPPPPTPSSTPIAYSLTSLFADEQHRILRTILNRTLSEMEDSLRKIYEDHASLLHYLTESGIPAPPALALAASFALNSSLRRALEASHFDPVEIEDLFHRAASEQITLDTHLLSFVAGMRMKQAMVRLEAAAAGEASANAALNQALTIAIALRTLPLEVNLWQSQNIWNDLLRRSDSDYWEPDWKEGFKKLGEAMNISVDHLVVEEGVSAF